MLPSEFQQVCEERWKERSQVCTCCVASNICSPGCQAKLDLQTALAALPEAERAQYLKSSAAGSSTPADKVRHLCVCTVDTYLLLSEQDVVMKSPSKADKSGETSTKKGSVRVKKAVDPEVAAKEKEKQEKKMAKAEKDKKVAEVRYMYAAVAQDLLAIC